MKGSPKLLPKASSKLLHCSNSSFLFMTTQCLPLFMFICHILIYSIIYFTNPTRFCQFCLQKEFSWSLQRCWAWGIGVFYLDIDSPQGFCPFWIQNSVILAHQVIFVPLLYGKNIYVRREWQFILKKKSLLIKLMQTIIVSFPTNFPVADMEDSSGIFVSLTSTFK